MARKSRSIKFDLFIILRELEQNFLALGAIVLHALFNLLSKRFIVADRDRDHLHRCWFVYI